MDELVDMLNKIPGERRWGTFITGKSTFGEFTTATIASPNGGSALVTMQPVVRPSGKQKWIVNVLYSGNQSTVVSEKDMGDAFMSAMKNVGAA
ncbi:hypothetical protein RvY_15160 [Ramazzottius varieornatus]|uniref:Uncharacterized protein n=1 Tax=Ramazzottius varieornatus TaxID=947166 RepID=A0A1D1VXE7_RAMVA|nr:hypothetical protein RvY_15160 [Ramazzottius varieornatus]